MRGTTIFQEAVRASAAIAFLVSSKYFGAELEEVRGGRLSAQIYAWHSTFLRGPGASAAIRAGHSDCELHCFSQVELSYLPDVRQLWLSMLAEVCGFTSNV